jgi:hypothetical protein
VADHVRCFGWQGLQKGTAVAGADAIGCRRRELGGACHWSIWAGIVSDAATISAQIAVSTDPAQMGDAAAPGTAARFKSSSTGVMHEQAKHAA